MSKINEDNAVNGPTDGETNNTKISSLNRKGVKSFRINSSDPSLEMRRPATTQILSQQHNHVERTSSNLYKPPTNKKKELVSTDASRSPGTLSTAIGYITSPARYIGSLFTGKKEPMVVKSAPTLNKEKVKPISSKQLKEPLSEIMPDADKKHATDISPSPTMLSASNTTVSNNSSLIKKSDSKIDGKKNASVSKRSMSQNSKYAHKLKTSPITLKEKKVTSPGQAPAEVKVIAASSVQITTTTQGAYRVSSKTKEEPPPKTKKDVRKTSPERKTKTVPQTLTTSTPTPNAKKQHLINTLLEKMDKAEETSGPTVLTYLQPSLLPTESSIPIGPNSTYPPKFKKMIGGARTYERAEEALPRQLANKCTPDFRNIDVETTPTFLTPTCLETDNFVDASENVAIVSLSANTLVNTPSLSNIDSYENANKASVELFPTPLFPTILHSPNMNSTSHSQKRMTSPESKPIQEKEPDPMTQKSEKIPKSASPKYKPGSFSPSRNVNGNFQPLSPNEPDKASGSGVQDSTVAAVSTPAQRGASHAYRVISPDRLPISFQEYGQHKYRSTSRSPTRSNMPYPQGNSMNSYTERYNALKNKKKAPNRSGSPFANGNRQNMKGKPDADNPVIIVMPSKKFKELAQEYKQVDPVPERIVVTPRGSYKVTTRPSDTTVAKKPSNSTLTLGEVSTSSNVIGPDNVHSNKETLESQPLISHNSSPVKEQIPDVDTKPPPPPCKGGIMLKSTDKLQQAPSLSSKVSDKNFVQETVRRLKTSFQNKEVDYFNSLDQYGGSPAQHAAASTMLGEFP